jgi:outer membrane receptor protein involved in Fe transport
MAIYRGLLAQDTPGVLPDVTVTADRLPTGAAEEVFSPQVISREEIETAPQMRLDDILRNASPGFSLFRRSSSRVANPTTQGVSLRNLGPNGAGRTLVLLDGLPLNDPFAGWVPWTRVPPASVREIIVNPGGGAGLFGNAALAGTIHLLGSESSRSYARLLGTVGDCDTYEAALDTRMETGKVGLSTFVDRFSTDGYPVLQANQRGPVDTSADADSWLWQSRLDWQPDGHTRLALSGAVFEEHRNNGTQLTRNATRGEDFSLAAQRAFPDLDGEMRVQTYLQRRRYRSTFTSVNEDRTQETPALDQFDVPATAAGGSAVWSQQLGDAHRVVGGVDARWVEGETNEFYFRSGDAFTRLRNAGGRQLFVGAFFEENWQATDAVSLVVGGRVDYWRQYDGLRVERERGGGVVLQDTRFDDQDGFAPNGRIGLHAKLARSIQARAAAYTGFRAPTLNELYRPFRVGNDITEANAALDPERLIGAEVGVEWEPVERFSFSVTGFYNRLRDAVGNVTIGEGPGTFDPGGFVPTGGVLRERQNLDRVEVIGVEAKLIWQMAPTVRLRAQYLFTHPTVTRASEAPVLEGKQLAQAPEHIAVAALEWTPGHWQTSAQIRYVGEQFEDDLNTLTLAPFTTVDLSLGYQFNTQLSASLKVENLFDTEAETGKTASGLVNIGAPRLWSLTVALSF